MKKNILYISSACSLQTFFKLEAEKQKQGFIYGMPVAANKFHNLIMQGFLKNDYDVQALVGRPVSLKSHHRKWWKKSIEVENNITFINLPFINLPFIKYLFIGFSCFFNIIKWKQHDGCIIYDAAYVSIIPFIVFANFFKKVKTIAVFSDVYNYMYDVDTKNTNYQLLSKISRKLMKYCYQKTYGYVFLSKQMNDLINKNNKPYCVIEGIADSQNINNQVIEKYSKKIIMYAGALRCEYGLEILLKGFMNYHNDDVELWIFGLGDYLEEIKKMSKLDKRIKYQGVKDNHEITKIEKQVTLLVNPRPSNLEFTQYSFPSKLMEYMSSGSAVLTTKLPTIPKEYHDYLYYIDEETKNGITKSLEKVLSKNISELENFGKKAQKFIHNNKVEKKQIQKIINMLELEDRKNG